MYVSWEIWSWTSGTAEGKFCSILLYLLTLKLLPQKYCQVIVFYDCGFILINVHEKNNIGDHFVFIHLSYMLFLRYILTAQTFGNQISTFGIM